MKAIFASLHRSTFVRRCLLSNNKTIQTSRIVSSCSFSTSSDDIISSKEWNNNNGLDKPEIFQIKCLDGVSMKGLDCLPKSKYNLLSANHDTNDSNIQAILVGGHTLTKEQIPSTVQAIARCGAGTSNIPINAMTQNGIPVFNTPGANKNAVAELILCSLLLGSRRIIDGINHMIHLGSQNLARERVEKDKAMFGGREIKGKTLAVIGLGNIGTATAQGASTLGMKIVGYDPAISVQHALSLPKDIQIVDSISSAVVDADYIALIIPYIEGEGGTHGIISQEVIGQCKSDAVIVNFGHSDIVDSEDMKSFLDTEKNSRYITDFADEVLWNHSNCIIMPHLGASTMEAEEAAATMAAETIRDFLETGTIRNSVNFPNLSLSKNEQHVRLCVVNRNVSGALASIVEAVAKANLNIIQEINLSRGDIAYTVIDIDKTSIQSSTEDGDGDSERELLSLKKLQDDIAMSPSCLSCRIILG